jgi:hypothetical protein
VQIREQKEVMTAKEEPYGLKKASCPEVDKF